MMVGMTLSWSNDDNDCTPHLHIQPSSFDVETLSVASEQELKTENDQAIRCQHEWKKTLLKLRG